ncbi:hypothetical protein [Cerasicoccus arenae]|uniref:Porin n=1 Tax=Cerasicoccus arenae TaxID=424488 RepID=A0A8J3DAP7_9BACT|nr:hypothetical protein [Cerasicoccus arenae]MBK1859158.1 hypothetical protein [Cerasicoccus arenae]GHB98187.1 hypothetical protein GCM10007047_12750 [Cerasicoccus arenae]
MLSKSINWILLWALSGVVLTPCVWAEPMASGISGELAELRAMLKAQQEVIGELQQEVLGLRGELDNVRASYVAITPPQVMNIEQGANQQLPAPEPPPPASLSPDLSFKHRDWSFEVYGFVKLDASYDTHRVYNGDFVRYVYPEAGSDDNQLSITARETRLGLKINGPEWEGWHPSARIETDFYGNANSSTPALRMRLAYAQMERGDWQFRAGQDWDALTVALPRTVNCGSYAYQGALWSRRPLVKATWRKDTGGGELRVIGAIASAVSADIDGGGQPDGNDSGVPNCELTAVCDWRLAEDWTLTTALGGEWGQEAFDRPTGGESVYDSYAGMLTMVLNWKDRAKLMGAAWVGSDLGSFNGGIGQTVNLAKSESIKSRGGWIQLQTFPWEDFNWNMALGVDDPEDSDLSVGMRRFNVNASTSVFYKFTSYLTLAAEYSFLQTGYVGLPTANSNRIQTSVIVEF